MLGHHLREVREDDAIALPGHQPLAGEYIEGRLHGAHHALVDAVQVGEPAAADDRVRYVFLGEKLVSPD